MRRNDPKKEISQKALDYFKRRVWDLPYLDRVDILTLSIIDHEHEAFAASNGLIALIYRMSKGYGRTNKLMVAESLRNAADVLDHELQKEVV